MPYYEDVTEGILRVFGAAAATVEVPVTKVMGAERLTTLGDNMTCLLTVSVAGFLAGGGPSPGVVDLGVAEREKDLCYFLNT